MSRCSLRRTGLRLRRSFRNVCAVAIVAGGFFGCSLSYRPGVYHDAEDEAICNRLDTSALYSLSQARWNYQQGNKDGAKLWLLLARDSLEQFLAYCQWEPAEAYETRQQLFFALEEILKDSP